jgi:hypothetical protein
MKTIKNFFYFLVTKKENSVKQFWLSRSMFLYCTLPRTVLYCVQDAPEQFSFEPTPANDENQVHAGVVLKGAGEEPVQVESLTPTP